MNNMLRPVFLLALFCCCIYAPSLAADPYIAGIQQWQTEFDKYLVGPEGPFTRVARLSAKPGVSSFGRDSDNDLVLPVKKAPAHVGKIDWSGNRATLKLEPGVTAIVSGKAVTQVEICEQAGCKEDVSLTISGMGLTLRFRESRLLLSVGDPDAPKRKEAKAPAWFPIDPRYRITANWIPFPEPKMVRIPDTDGGSRMWKNTGYASFTIDGKKLTLQGVLTTGGKEMSFFFRDLTSAHETYGAGRFFEAELPKNGKIILDFNKAYNPYCAYTSFYFCPIPPKENHLPVRIPTGELNYAH